MMQLPMGVNVIDAGGDGWRAASGLARLPHRDACCAACRAVVASLARKLHGFWMGLVEYVCLVTIVVEGKDILPGKHSSTSASLYISCEFGAQKRKTKTVKNTLEPNWGEVFDLYVILLQHRQGEPPSALHSPLRRVFVSLVSLALSPKLTVSIPRPVCPFAALIMPLTPMSLLNTIVAIWTRRRRRP